MNMHSSPTGGLLARLQRWWPEMLCLALAALFLSVMLAVREIIFFRDYAIIWDGAVRMLQGQSPFSDFGMPTGPVSLFLPYVFLKLFGVSWPVFQATQIFINVLLLANLLWLQAQLGEQRWLRLSSAGVFTLFYLLLLTHPWYNTTALLLVMLGLNLLLLPGAGAKAAAGGVAGLCVFTKQDFGGLLILMAPLLMVWDASLQRRPAASVLREIMFWGLGLGAMLALMALAYGPGHLSYWFNYGQEPHARRALSWTSLGDWTFAIGAGYVLLACWLRSRALLVYGLILLMAWVTRQTSGLYFTHFYSVLAVMPLLTLGLREPRLKRIRVFLPAIALMLLWRPAMHSSAVFLNLAHSQPEHFFFGAGFLPAQRPPATDLSACSPVLRHIVGPKDVCELQTEVNAKIREGRIAAGGQLLNMTELTPLTWALGMKPPLQHPLWYHPAVVYFPREHGLMLQQIDQGQFDLILLQGAHSGFTPVHAQLVNAIQTSGQYEPASRAFASPSSLTDCGVAYGCEIFVFWRKPAGTTTTQSQHALKPDGAVK